MDIPGLDSTQQRLNRSGDFSPLPTCVPIQKGNHSVGSCLNCGGIAGKRSDAICQVGELQKEREEHYTT